MATKFLTPSQEKDHESKAVIMAAIWRIMTGHTIDGDFRSLGGTTVTVGAVRQDGVFVQATIYMGDLRPLEVHEDDSRE